MSSLVNKLQEVSADEIMREKYNAREKARLDYKSAMKYAENRGMERGIEKGMERGIEKGKQEGVRRRCVTGSALQLVKGFYSYNFVQFAWGK